MPAKVNLIDNFLQDIRFGLRILRRSPGFSILRFLPDAGHRRKRRRLQWIEGILFRPYPAVAHQERLVALGGTSRAKPKHPLPGPTIWTCNAVAPSARRSS